MGISIDAQLLSLRTLFDPELAGDLKLTVAMELDGQEFFATVAGAALVAERGEAASADVSDHRLPFEPDRADPRRAAAWTR